MQFKVESDGETISVALDDGNFYSFRSSEKMGKILNIEPYGRKFLIVREFGLETLQTTLDQSRFRLRVLASFPNKIINLRQIKYRLDAAKRRQKNA